MQPTILCRIATFFRIYDIHQNLVLRIGQRRLYAILHGSGTAQLIQTCSEIVLVGNNQFHIACLSLSHDKLFSHLLVSSGTKRDRCRTFATGIFFHGNEEGRVALGIYSRLERNPILIVLININRQIPWSVGIGCLIFQQNRIFFRCQVSEHFLVIDRNDRFGQTGLEDIHRSLYIIIIFRRDFNGTSTNIKLLIRQHLKVQCMVFHRTCLRFACGAFVRRHDPARVTGIEETGFILSCVNSKLYGNDMLTGIQVFVGLRVGDYHRILLCLIDNEIKLKATGHERKISTACIRFHIFGCSYPYFVAFAGRSFAFKQHYPAIIHTFRIIQYDMPILIGIECQYLSGISRRRKTEGGRFVHDLQFRL